MAGVLDGVSPHRAIHANGGGEVGGVLGDRVGGGGSDVMMAC